MAIPDQEFVSLGKTGITIPPMGVGAMAWGDRIFWGYGHGYAVPIPGAKNRQQAFENAGALGWHLSDSELIALDQASNRLS